MGGSASSARVAGFTGPAVDIIGRGEERGLEGAGGGEGDCEGSSRGSHRGWGGTGEDTHHETVKCSGYEGNELAPFVLGAAGSILCLEFFPPT